MGFLNGYIIIKMKFVIINGILQKSCTSASLSKISLKFYLLQISSKKNVQIVAITTLGSEMLEKEVVHVNTLSNGTDSFFLSFLFFFDSVTPLYPSYLIRRGYRVISLV